MGNSSGKLKTLKAIIRPVGVLLSTTLWMLRDNPVISNLTKKRGHRLSQERANRLHSGTHNLFLKISNAFGVILPFRFDTNGVVTPFVDQKQMPAAVQAGVISCLLTDSSIRELTHSLGTNSIGTLAAELRSQDWFIRPGVQRIKRRRSI